MPSKNPRLRLRDIVDNIDRINLFVENFSLDQFVNDTKTFYAVERAVLIISEAARRLPDDLKTQYPGVDWKGVAGIGNKIRHDYDDINPRILWITIKSALGPLRSVALEALSEVD